MGAYLSEPVTTKDSEEKNGSAMSYSACSMQGWRKEQEDAHIASLALPNGETVFGVFDGHGGAQVAKFVAKKFVEVLTSNADYKAGNYEKALTQTFISLDELMTSEKSNDPITAYSMSTGCTSCVAMIAKGKIFCANSGDSRCVLSRAGNAIEMSEDHKPDNEGEKKRIEEAGGFVEDGRVRGTLSLSRALGDMEYKLNRKKGVEGQMITCVPEIRVETMSDKDDFVIIACDGIWDCKTSQECVTSFAKLIKDRKSGERRVKIIETLFDEILCKDVNDPNSDGSGTDNMTCIVIEINK